MIKVNVERNMFPVAGIIKENDKFRTVVSAVSSRV